MGFTQVQVTGTITNSDSSPAAGVYVIFTLTGTIYASDSGTFVTPSPQSAMTQPNGTFSITLVATDDSTTFPKGQAYRCEVQVPSTTSSGLFAAGNQYPVYVFALPSSTAPVVDLGQLI